MKLEINENTPQRKPTEEEMIVIHDFIHKLLTGEKQGFIVAAHVDTDGIISPLFMAKDLCKKCVRKGIMNIVESAFARDSTIPDTCEDDEDGGSPSIKKPSPYFKKL